MPPINAPSIPWLWVISVLFSICSIWCYWRFVRNLPSTYENRLGGVKDKASRLLYILLFTAGVYYLFDLVSAWYSLPLWSDGAALVGFLGMGILVVRVLMLNPKFRYEKVRKLWLAPLGVGCVGISVAAKLGDQTPTVATKVAHAVSETAVGKTLDNTAETVVSTATRVVEKLRPRPSLATDTIEGVITFRNTIEKGAIGDRVAHKVFGGMQYTHHRSKFKGNKGIDGVYTYTDKHGTEHLYLVENKTKGSPLSEGQMSDDWIDTKLQEMQTYGDKQVRDTATMIQATKSPESKVSVHKVLVEHNLETGVLQCFEVTGDGRKGVLAWEKNCEPTMRVVLIEYKDKLAKGEGAIEELAEEVAEAVATP